MGAQINDTGRQYQALGVDRLRCVVINATEIGDPAVLDRQIGLDQWVAETVGDTGIPENEVIHIRVLSPSVRGF